VSRGTRQCNDWLRTFLEYTDHTESPVQFRLWTGVFTIAGALGRKVWIEDGQLNYYPNFYIVFVGPPGVARKSTSIKMGEELLREVPTVRFAPNSTSWQALLQRLAEATITVPVGPGHVARVDEGELFMGEQLTMSCISAVAKELGPFMSLRNADMVDVMTDLWDGTNPQWERLTLMHGSSVILNPWLNLIAATTPSWLKDNTTETTIGGGFASRCVWIYGDVKQQLVPYQKLAQQHDQTALRARLVNDINIIGDMLGEMKLTKAAYEWGSEWYVEMHKNPPPHLQSQKFEAVLSRRQTQLHKLAMVLTAAEGDAMDITVEILQRADAVLRSAEVYIPQVFEKIGMTLAAKTVSSVVGEIRRLKRVRKQVLMRSHTILSPKELNDALQEAILSGEIIEQQIGAHIYLVYNSEEEVTHTPEAQPLPQLDDKASDTA